MAERYESVTVVERRHDFFLDHLPKHRRRALDLGCGSGLLALELAKRFEAVVALDISEPMLVIARRKRAAANLDYRLGDADELELKEKFDLIVSHTTFHHLKNIPRVLATLQAALEPGGRLIIVDLVDRWRFFPRKLVAAHFGTACARLAPDVFRYGLSSAGLLFRFRKSRAWLDHLVTDRYLTTVEFAEVYGRLLPGATFIPLKHFMGVVWQRPD